MKELCMTWEEKLAEAERVHTVSGRGEADVPICPHTGGCVPIAFCSVWLLVLPQ